MALCACSRRQFLKGSGAGFAVCVTAFVTTPRTAAAADQQQRVLIAEAERMRQDAIARGDQPFGAVIAMDGSIVGYGPSRVVLDRNPDAHAERVAIWDAQKRLGRDDLSRAILYSTSRPCPACETVAAGANVERMIFGNPGVDAGQPRRR